MTINKKYEGFSAKKIQPQKVNALLEKDKVFILDVRPQNFKKGPKFIIGAYHCPLLNITERIDELPKNRPIIISDWAMRQSPLAAKYLLANGFSNVIGVVKGGIERWVQEGLPTEKRLVLPNR